MWQVRRIHLDSIGTPAGSLHRCHHRPGRRSRATARLDPVAAQRRREVDRHGPRRGAHPAAPQRLPLGLRAPQRRRTPPRGLRPRLGHGPRRGRVGRGRRPSAGHGCRLRVDRSGPARRPDRLARPARTSAGTSFLARRRPGRARPAAHSRSAGGRPGIEAFLLGDPRAASGRRSRSSHEQQSEWERDAQCARDRPRPLADDPAR